MALAAAFVPEVFPPPPPPPLSPPLESARTAATAMAATAMMMTTKRPPRMAQRYLPARAVPSGRRPSVPAMDSSELADLDRQHLWHPFTQQQGWEEEDSPIIERARRHDALRHRGQRLHRRRLVAVVQRPRPSPPGDRHRRSGPARPRRALDDARPLARAGDQAGQAPGRPRARRASPASSSPTTARRRRDRAEDGLPVPRTSAASGGARASSACATATTATRSARSRSAASSSSTRSTARCSSTPGRREPGDADALRALLAEHGERSRR